MIDTEEGVAPTVERWTPNPTVVGSNPIALTFLFIFYPKIKGTFIFAVRVGLGSYGKIARCLDVR